MNKKDRQKALDTIVQEIESCEECKIGKSGKAVPGEGNPDADIVFIGEAPGRQEAQTGRPFIGRSGQLLRKLIRSIGLDDEKDVYITSPVKYLPDRPARNATHIVAGGSAKASSGGGTPTSADISHGRIHLMEQFDVIQPKFIVLLGRVAAEGVLQSRISVMQEHGKVIKTDEDGRKYFLTYHPAAALRFRKNLEPLEADFSKLKILIKNL